jgi:hypothetical protein
MGRLGAIPEVLPFLIDMVQSPETAERAELLALLVELVRGAEDYSRFRVWYAGDQAAFVGSIQQAFERGLPVYLECLAAEDPKLRGAAAEAVSLIPASDAGSLLLEQLTRERDAGACQALLGALGKLRFSVALPTVLHFLDSESLSTRLRAAAAACRLGQPMPDRAFTMLAGMAMLGTERHQPRSREQDLLESDVSVGAILALEELGEEGLERAVERWIAGLPAVEDENVHECLHRMVAWTIPPKHDRERRDTLASRVSRNGFVQP